ncbi:MAG: hypothetical protein ABIS50_04280 [Luteolibacter sp.]|uniref:hypothetical protein n=1 Tax=Luteolibacter sp. TaxID=1962973 RepID=UPI00326685E6
MKPRSIAIALLLSGIVFGLASLGQVTVATHLHTPGTSILLSPELEIIIGANSKLREKLRDEDEVAQKKILTIVGAHLQVCVLLGVAGGFQVVAGLLLLHGEKRRS